MSKKPWHASCSGGTHSLSSGTDVRLLLFCTMLAWFLRDMRRVEGARRHGSPSTCTGSVLKVVRTTSLHWCSRSPWPPTCSAAFRWRRETHVSHEPYISFSVSQKELRHSPARPWWSRSPRCSRRRASADRNLCGRPCCPTAWYPHSTYRHQVNRRGKTDALLRWMNPSGETGINVKPTDSQQICHLSSHYLLLIKLSNDWTVWHYLKDSTLTNV